MGKKYNLSKNSDMKKLVRDLTDAVQDKTVDILNNRTYDITCPHCNQQISVMPGKSQCPLCHQDIDLNLNIHF